MTLILALDTSAEACSVALGMGETVFFRRQVAPRRHGELALPMIRDVLAEAGLSLAQVDALAFGRGPGAFTGLRIAAGVVQGLASGIDRPVVPVSTLAAMARQGAMAAGRSRVHAAMDARMGEVYWGSFDVSADGDVRAVGEERVIAPAGVAGTCRAEFGPPAFAVGVGTGWPLLVPHLEGAICPDQWDGGLLPDAVDVLHLARAVFAAGGGIAAADARPVYLRDEVVQVRAPASAL